MSNSSAFCPASETCVPRSATLVWSVTRAARLTLHQLYHAGSCYGPAPFGPDDPGARRPRQACENAGCIDLFMNVWMHAHTAMHNRFGEDVAAVPGAAFAYLTTSARARAADLNREGRVQRGGAARPQRRDGIIGRIAASYDDPWLADMFRFLLGYAASSGGQGDGWPLDVLTQRKNAWDARERTPGSSTARQELRQDAENCLAVVREVAGSGWLYDYILMPLANRTGHAVLAEDDVLKPPGVDEQEAELRSAATSMLGDMLCRIAAGANQGTALRAAVDAWLGDSPCPDAWAATRADDLAVKRLAKRLVAESAEHGEAA